MNGDLVLRSLNYHGQQLTSFMQEMASDSAELELLQRAIDFTKVDYRMYQSRGKELQFDDRGKRLLLHQFIAQNAKQLFSYSHTEPLYTNSSLVSRDPNTSATVPPIEVYLSSSAGREERARHFFELVQPKDVVYCKIGAKNMSGLLLTIVCFSPAIGKSRHVEDLKIKCFCPSAEMIAPNNPTSLNNAYETGSYVCTVILEVKREAQRLLVSTKDDALPSHLKNKVKLGLVSPVELPQALELIYQAKDGNLPYEKSLIESSGFQNPSVVQELCSDLGLNSKGSSLIASLKADFPHKKCAEALRKAQNAKWAFSSVTSGIKHFKAGNVTEAFQCLNQALKMDPENVEGLVARGALYANKGSLEKAIEDFELALKSDNTHKNARNYLCETLIAFAQSLENTERFEDAKDAYNRVLAINPQSQDAKERLILLEAKKLGIKPEFLPKSRKKRDRSSDRLNLGLEDKEDDDGTSRSERKKRKKRHRRSSSSSSSSSSSDSSSSSESSSPSSRRHRKKKKRSKKKKAKNRSDSEEEKSPFSKKMSLEGSKDLPYGANASNSIHSIVPPSGSNMESGENNLNFPGKEFGLPIPSLETHPPIVPPPSFPQPSHSALGPGYAAYQQYPPTSSIYNPYPHVQKSQKDEAYEKAVQDFLRHTTGQKSSRGHIATSSFEPENQLSRSRSVEKSNRLQSVSKDHVKEDEKDGKKKKKKKDKDKDRSEKKKKKHKKHKKTSSDEEEEKEKSKKKKKKLDDPKNAEIEDLVKMGFGQDMDVDSFAEKLSTFLKAGATGKEKKTDGKNENEKNSDVLDKAKEEQLLIESTKAIHVEVEGLDIKLNPLKAPEQRDEDEEEERRARKEDSVPSRYSRIASPSVKAAFGGDDSPQHKATTVSKAEEQKALWKPEGQDSMREKYREALSRLERLQKSKTRSRSRSPNRPGNSGYTVEYDKKTGMFQRKYNTPPSRGFRYGSRPPFRPRGRGRGYFPHRYDRRSPNYGRRGYRDYRDRSPDRYRKDYRDRSRSPNRRHYRDRSRSRSPDRGHYRDRSRSPDHSKRSYRDYSRSPERSRKDSPRQSPELKDVLSQSEILRKERENIEKEKAELLGNSGKKDQERSRSRSRSRSREREPGFTYSW